MDRALILVTAAICAAIGLFFMAAPDRAAAAVGIALTNPTARIDVQATYGGMCVGLGVWMAACAQRPEWNRVGLIGVGATFGGLALGRGLAMARGTPAEPMMWLFLGIEVAFAVAAVVRYTRQ